MRDPGRRRRGAQGDYQNWVQAIRTGSPLLAAGTEGINGVELSNAMLLSTWTDDWVHIPVDEDLYYEELQKRVATSKVKEESGKVMDVQGRFNTKRAAGSCTRRWLEFWKEGTVKLALMSGNLLSSAEMRSEGFEAVQMFFGGGADGDARDPSAEDIDKALQAADIALAAMTLHVDLVGPKGMVREDVTRLMRCVKKTATLEGRFGDNRSQCWCGIRRGIQRRMLTIGRYSRGYAQG